MPSRRTALLAVGGINLIWAGTYVAGKAALDTIPFVVLNGLRFGLAAVVVAPLVWRNRGVLPRDRTGRLRLLGIALFGFVGNKALEFLGLSMTTATDTALLITAESLATLLLAVLVLGDRLRLSTALALSVGTVGVYVLVEGGLVAPHLPRGPQGTGDALVVVSLLLEAVATISGAALLSGSRGGFTITGAAVIIGALVWVPVNGIRALAGGGLPHPTAAGWLGVVYLAVFTTVIAYGGWFWALQRLSAQDVTPLLLIQPVAGTLIAALVRGERPGGATVAGGGLVLAGVAMVGLRRDVPAIEEPLLTVPEAP
ncbi:MAG: DMT family transporter [Candidatus Dormibacteria bacterium]